MQRYFAMKKYDNKLILNSNDIHHIKNVMRMKVNDNIEVIHDKTIYICSINSISNDSIDISILEKLEENNELPINITIAFSLTKEDKIDLILQKCTELGVTEFIPLELSRCVVKIKKDKMNKKIERWQNICKEASEQSKRNVIPKVNNIMNIKDIIDLDYDLKIVCSVNQGVTNIKKVLQNSIKYDRIIIVIGPEGGISDLEENYLIENNFIPTSLGRRVLRCETAPITICSMINYEYME